MSVGDWYWHYNLWQDTGLAGSIGNVGPQGAVGPSGTANTQGGIGANGPPGPTVTSVRDPALISVTNNNKEVMRITADGNVEWYGKPSKAADGLRLVLGNLIDERVKPSTRQRMYANACRSILSKARTMDKEELINHLEQSISNRESKVVLMALREMAELENEELSK